MSEYVDFHYMPLEGKITGKQVLKQTEDAINDLGNKVYSLDIDQSEIDEAIEKSNEAINTANSALSAVTTGRSVWFNNVAEMVATDIEAGVTAETKGYHVANDGGNALYLIRQEKSGDVVDGGSLIALDNGNMAELVTDGTVNVKQFGAIGNGTDDDTTVFQNTSSYAQAKGFVPFVGVATYKITSNITGAFNSFGEVTITGGGTVDIINLQEVVSDVSDIRDEVVDETASAKAYSESAATSATNASNSASSASTTATQLMAYLETKETLTAPAVDPTLTISGAAADAKVVGDQIGYIENMGEPLSYSTVDSNAIVYADGTVTSNSGCARTGYIDVSGCKYIQYGRFVRSSQNSTYGMAFYSNRDESSYISGQRTLIGITSVIGQYVDTIIEVPATAQYARFTMSKENKSGFYVQKLTDLDSLVKLSAEKIAETKMAQNSIVGMRNIAYSLIGIAPINTVEHYLSVPKLGFNCIKGDVRITSDDKLVMCHDAGFTLNESGKITTYDSGDNTPIIDMTEAEVLTLEHSTYRDQLGYYAHPCTFEDYIRVCKESGLPPFITLRDEYMDNIIPLVFATLKKYHLEDKSIINSFSKETLLKCKLYYPNVRLSWVQESSATFNNALVDATKDIGNCILSLQKTDFTGFESVLEYAKGQGVEIYNAILYSFENYQKAVQAGVTGCQIGRMMLTYSRTLYAFKVSVTSGVIAFEDYYNGNRYTASASGNPAEGYVAVSGIGLSGSNRSFPDGLMPAWMNVLPHKIEVTESHGYECTAFWQHATSTNRIAVRCAELRNGSDCDFAITVEV